MAGLSGLVAVILAAGAGRRLRPLTDRVPKALCPVGGVPLLDLALASVTPYANPVAVNAHHFAEQLVRQVGGRAHVSVEQPEALGTAGALGALRGWIAGRPVLVRNADAYLPDGLDPLLDGWAGECCRLLAAPAGAGRADFGELRYVGAALLPWTAVAGLAPVPSGLYEVLWRDADLDLVVTEDLAIDCGTPDDYRRANRHAAERAGGDGGPRDAG